MKIIPHGPPLGATVNEVDLVISPTAELVHSLELALEQYGVLIFPNQNISPEQQIYFSRGVGEIETANTVSAPLIEFPELAEVGNVGNHPVSFAPPMLDGELEWHTDHIQHPVPAKSTLLYAREIPPEGGDTLFACMFEAYDALDFDVKQRCDTAIAMHSASGLRAYLDRQGEFDVDNIKIQEHDDVVHWPLVRRHPLTGRKALYFGAAVTVGIKDWPEEEARAFIATLTTHATQPRFIYRHKWEVDQVVLWDNRRVLHAATWYDKQRYRRYLLRTMMKEDLGVGGV